jgi:hypothetical protein
LRLPDISYGTEESLNGEFVRHSDYASLQADKEAETKAVFDAIRLITQLRDENERLRKAGYAMAIKINVHGIADKFTDSQKLVDDWSAAAKEGRDAK